MKKDIHKVMAGLDNFFIKERSISPSKSLEPPELLELPELSPSSLIELHPNVKQLVALKENKNTFFPAAQEPKVKKRSFQPTTMSRSFFFYHRQPKPKYYFGPGNSSRLSKLV